MLLLAGLMATLLGPSQAAGQVTYGAEGLRIATPDGDFTAVVGVRNQIRFTTPFAVVPADAAEVGVKVGDDYRVFRSRLRVNGHVFSPRLRYQFQADFVEERIRDLSVTWQARPWLRLRAGRWKAALNRERIESSGAQLLVDRSILDRWFTLGRQQGVEVSGGLGGTRPRGGTYFLGAFRSVDAKGGPALPVWLGRYEWTWAGRELPSWQGDPDASRELLLAIGSTVARTEGAFAFYQGSGVGATLPLFPAGPPDRFRTRHYAGDVSLKWRGLSAQGEVHRKEVRRIAAGDRRTLRGAYLQGGVLASTVWERLPSRLELAARAAWIDPHDALADNHHDERVVGVNWYVLGHRHKIAADISRLRFTTPTGVRATDRRTRLQWEVTF